jgi:hypothetical protein
MPLKATIYRVLIASPNDLVDVRKSIPEVINLWNATHSEKLGAVLLPVMWETHLTPRIGDRPQAILNRQLIPFSDILIGVFRARIGTHTGRAESGTVEEIEEFISSGKPVLLYFSSEMVSLDELDVGQYQRLEKYKEECEGLGLIDRYRDLSDLREKLNRHLTNIIHEIHKQSSFEEIRTDDSTESLDKKLHAMLSRAEVDWSTERDIEPPGIDAGKDILERFTSALIDLRVLLQEKVSEGILKKIDIQISNLKKLHNHEVFLDGGKSYNEFWEKGNQVFDDLRIAFSEVQQTPQSLIGELEAIQVKILQLLAKSEDEDLERIEESVIHHKLSISNTVAKYHLDSLRQQKFIGANDFVNRPSLYFLKQKGREYLIKNSLI